MSSETDVKFKYVQVIETYLFLLKWKQNFSNFILFQKIHLPLY